MKLVLDTNVFISGIFWTGSSNKILELWKEEKFTLITSMDIISEIIGVLNDFKIQLPPQMITEWAELILKNSTVVEPKEKISAVSEDPSDNKFLETAVTGSADFIISQDNHLLKLKEFNSIKLLTPDDFLKLPKSNL